MLVHPNRVHHVHCAPPCSTWSAPQPGLINMHRVHILVCLMHICSCFIYRNQCYIPHSVMNPTGLTRQRAKHHWQDVLDKETLSLPRTMDCFHKIDMDPKLGYNLPKRPGMIAGQILKHCYGVVDSVVEAHAPCIFKIGYTHCAHFRFYNEKFGYSSDPCKWERMIVIHDASETISCSFIEAAIIQRHKGSLNAHQFDICIQI